MKITLLFPGPVLSMQRGSGPLEDQDAPAVGRPKRRREDSNIAKGRHDENLQGECEYGIVDGVCMWGSRVLSKVLDLDGRLADAVVRSLETSNRMEDILDDAEDFPNRYLFDPFGTGIWSVCLFTSSASDASNLLLDCINGAEARIIIDSGTPYHACRGILYHYGPSGICSTSRYPSMVSQVSFPYHASPISSFKDILSASSSRLDPHEDACLALLNDTLVEGSVVYIQAMTNDLLKCLSGTFLRALYTLCTVKLCTLAVDETLTALRSGQLWIHSAAGILAHYVVFGKGLGISGIAMNTNAPRWVPRIGKQRLSKHEVSTTIFVDPFMITRSERIVDMTSKILKSGDSPTLAHAYKVLRILESKSIIWDVHVWQYFAQFRHKTARRRNLWEASFIGDAECGIVAALCGGDIYRCLFLLA